jgi:hypothetical protein
MTGRRTFQLEDVIEKSETKAKHKKEKNKQSQEQLFESITNAAKRNALSNLNMVLDESDDSANSYNSETLSF